ncbi:MAG: hypothetical protein AAF493_10995 [Pseudomonadota bacterium]
MATSNKTNLTLSEEIVVRAEAFVTKPEHDLVIMRERDDGREFFTIVQAGGRFKPRLRDKRRELSGYHVSRGKRRRYSFRRATVHVDGVHTFDVTFEMRYSVTDAQRVVERLFEDPLSIIREEIADAVSADIRSLEWQFVEATPELTSTVRSMTTESGGDYVNLLEHFKDVAADYGVEIDSLIVGRALHEDDVSVVRHEIELDRSEAKADLTHEAAKSGEARDAEIKTLRFELARESERVEDLNRMQRQIRNSVGDFVQSLADSANQMAANATSIPELGKLVAQAGMLKQQLSLLGDSEVASAPAMLGGAQPTIDGRLHWEGPAVADPNGAPEELITQLVLMSRKISTGEADQHRFLSAAFHLIGAALDPDARDVQRFADEFDGQLRGASANFEDEELKFATAVKRRYVGG